MLYICQMILRPCYFWCSQNGDYNIYLKCTSTPVNKTRVECRVNIDLCAIASYGAKHVRGAPQQFCPRFTLRERTPCGIDVWRLFRIWIGPLRGLFSGWTESLCFSDVKGAPHQNTPALGLGIYIPVPFIGCSPVTVVTGLPLTPPKRCHRTRPELLHLFLFEGCQGSALPRTTSPVSGAKVVKCVIRVQ